MLTDGRSNAGRLTPLQAAQAAEALDIRVYTIGVGAMEGSGGGIFGMFRRGDHVDEEKLQAIATQTGGRYFRATDTRSLREIYATIDELETSTAEVREYVHREELYRWALLPGLALLAVHLLLGWTVFRRLP
jgi:Ca-activated chloride channel family protein